jgi:hypothetical protein
MLGLLTACSPNDQSEPQVKEPIAILSALPLFWAEGDPQLALSQETQTAPIIDALRMRFDVQPVDLLSPENLKSFRLLMLAQPRVLSPQELVVLDEWVLAGGRVVIFADPQLEWPSLYGLGDPRRAPPVTLLDPLFTHWKVTMAPVGPDAHQHEGTDEMQLMGESISTNAPARWTTKSNACVLADDGLRASCRIGKGKAELVADADLLDEASRLQEGGSNAGAVLALVESLAKGLPQAVSQPNQDQRKNKILPIGRDDSNLREKEASGP